MFLHGRYKIFIMYFEYCNIKHSAYLKIDELLIGMLLNILFNWLIFATQLSL